MRGEVCVGPNCQREQMVHFDVCRSHRIQQHRGKPLTELWTRHPADKGICRFEGCDRTCYGKADLCQAHKQQEYKGQELLPLGTRRNRKPPVVKKTKQPKEPKKTKRQIKAEIEEIWNDILASLEAGREEE